MDSAVTRDITGREYSHVLGGCFGDAGREIIGVEVDEKRINFCENRKRKESPFERVWHGYKEIKNRYYCYRLQMLRHRLSHSIQSSFTQLQISFPSLSPVAISTRSIYLDSILNIIEYLVHSFYIIELLPLMEIGKIVDRIEEKMIHWTEVFLQKQPEIFRLLIVCRDHTTVNVFSNYHREDAAISADSHSNFPSLSKRPPARVLPSRPPRPSLKVSKAARNILTQWLKDNQADPYPSSTDKDNLAQLTGMSILQINNWFINGRIRMERRKNGKRKGA